MRLILTCTTILIALALHAQSSPILTEFQQKWQNATAYTMEMAALMPDSLYDYRPTPDQMSFRQQLLHMAGNMVWLSTEKLDYTPTVTLPDYRALMDSQPDQAATLAALQVALSLTAAAAEALSPEDLDTTVDFFAGPMTKRQILTLLNDHHTHHRGQLVTYLRLNHIQPPRYRGW